MLNKIWSRYVALGGDTKIYYWTSRIMVFLRSGSLRSSLRTYATTQELGLKKVMVLSLSTKDSLMKPTICWRTWLSMIIGLGLAQGETKIGETILWGNKWTPDFTINWWLSMRYLFEVLIWWDKCKSNPLQQRNAQWNLPIKWWRRFCLMINKSLLRRLKRRYKSLGR